MKQKTGKKLLSFLLALAMVFALVPQMSFSASAGEEDEDMRDTPLTFEAVSGTATVRLKWSSADSVHYRTNNDSDWLKYTYDKVITLPGASDWVQFKGKNIKTGAANHFYVTGDCYVYGNVMSLVAGDGSLKEASIVEKSQFTNLFMGCGSLKNHSAKDIVVPATTLADYCYTNMFKDCEGLERAPELPATHLTKNCYNGMFQNCKILKEAPVLDATELAEGCYGSMFFGCTSLTTAPKLPATSLEVSCYSNMFAGCSNLNSVTCLATSISAYNATINWLRGVASTGTFTKAAGMERWGAGANGIPSGWTTVVPVESVTLNPSTAQTIDVDGKVSFTATVSPDDATDKTVKWSVGGTNADAVTLYSDEACTEGNEVTLDTATETTTVYAKGISAGSAAVTCTSNADDTKSASCDVTVNAAAPTTYSISCEGSLTDSTVTPDKTSAAAGEIVTLTITPDPGWELDALTVKDADNNDVTVDADYKFVMPASNVTITATYRQSVPATYYASYVNTTTSVKFHGLDWYIIQDNSTAVDEGTVTLLAKNPIGTSKFDEESNAYATSDVKNYLDAMTADGGQFADAADAIVGTDLSDVNVTNAKLYLLSIDEAEALSEGIRTCDPADEDDYVWLLRSTDQNTETTDAVACVICDSGEVFYYKPSEYTDNSGSGVPQIGTVYVACNVNWVCSVRPALQLDLSKVTFENGVFALPAPHTHEDAQGNTITFEAWESDTSLPATTGNYYLTKDVTLSSTWTVPSGTTNLCLNGYGITKTGKIGSAIKIQSGRTLNLFDERTAEHRYTIDTTGINYLLNGNQAGLGRVNDSLTEGYKTFYGGYITGSTALGNAGSYANVGGAIQVYGGTLTMDGGTIIGNTAQGGGAVYVERGTATLVNVNIIGNYATGCGGAAQLADGSLTIENGQILYNLAYATGGFHDTGEKEGILTIKNSSLKYNANLSRDAEQAGAIYLNRYRKAYLTNVTITDNIGTKNGGITVANKNDFGEGIYLSGSCVIKDNKNSSGNPGDVFLGTNGYIYIAENFSSDGSTIGVATSSPRIFTNGSTSGLKASTYKDNFFSDNSAYTVQTEGNELKLAIPYTVTIAEGITNGTVTAAPTTAAAGDTVTLTATPEQGYELSAITVTDSDSATVSTTVDPTDSNKYTFTMPASDVTVSATFTAPHVHQYDPQQGAIPRWSWHQTGKTWEVTVRYECSCGEATSETAVPATNLDKEVNAPTEGKVTFTATDAVGNTDSKTFQMTANITQASGSEPITGTAQNIAYGTQVKLTTAQSCDWKVNGVTISQNTNYIWVTAKETMEVEAKPTEHEQAVGSLSMTATKGAAGKVKLIINYALPKGAKVHSAILHRGYVDSSNELVTDTKTSFKSKLTKTNGTYTANVAVSKPQKYGGWAEVKFTYNDKTYELKTSLFSSEKG